MLNPWLKAHLFSLPSRPFFHLNFIMSFSFQAARTYYCHLCHFDLIKFVFRHRHSCRQIGLKAIETWIDTFTACRISWLLATLVRRRAYLKGDVLNDAQDMLSKSHQFSDSPKKDHEPHYKVGSLKAKQPLVCPQAILLRITRDNLAIFYWKFGHADKTV